MSDQVRVRIAPSPTGNLHLGTARTALYNYLFTRRHGGKFVFRLEDTDEERSNEAYTQDVIEGLKWLGLNWDEGPDIGGPYAPYRQTEKIDHYNNLANQLIASGHAYLCYCTSEELEEMRGRQKAAGHVTRYDNRCRHLTQQQIERYEANGRIPSIRFRIEEPQVIEWHDAIKGQIIIDSSDLGGDMVIVKPNGVAIYNFAVVVDDIDMKITHVIRGEDHIHNTAKQLLLYEALAKNPPIFAHVALIFDAERHKLSKRQHGEAVHIKRYRAAGYMPEALINYLAQMSWTPADGREIFTLAEACQMFDLERVSKSPAIFDMQKLNWFNSHYIRTLPLSVICLRAKPYLAEFLESSPGAERGAAGEYTNEQLTQLVACVRDGLTTLDEITAASRFFFVKKVTAPADLKESLLSLEKSQKVLAMLADKIDELPFGDDKGCKAVIDALGRELGLKGKDLYWPVRVALSGSVQGPDLGAMISILGGGRVRSRIEAALLPCRLH